ncbi:thymidylate synthase [Streptomyces daliensis]|uniref:thymidylate synthase n=1 Tax=Streptomyces daliensis TaxID=299421 RepID=A0A8T4J2X2_9ACTN|nr:thymidylate synthase [Streptomyces daliensis]
MQTPPLYPDFEHAYLDVLAHLTGSHEYRNAPRGNASREVLGLAFRLSDPRQRLPYLAARRVNPVFHFAEALWYLAGRNDLAMIAYYAPHMRPDSIDGVTIGGSAYGRRLFTTSATDTLSPFDQVLNLLRTEADSKRGVLPVFEAGELAVPGNPDVSCVVALHLLARDGKLHMVCYMRANDCDRGLLADVFCFTMIQEFAALQLGLELGEYTHFIGSAHIGDRDLDRVHRVLAEAQQRDTSPIVPIVRFPFPAMPAGTSFETISVVLEHEAKLRADRVRYTPAKIAALALDPYWQQAIHLFEIKRQLVHQPGHPVAAESLAALDPGLRCLVARRWPTRMPDTPAVLP